MIFLVLHVHVCSCLDLLTTRMSGFYVYAYAHASAWIASEDQASVGLKLYLQPY